MNLPIIVCLAVIVAIVVGVVATRRGSAGKGGPSR